MAFSPDQQSRRRAHAERMLARAERRQRQAVKLVAKWKLRIEELERAGVEARQAWLWSEEHAASHAANEDDLLSTPLTGQ